MCAIYINYVLILMFISRTLQMHFLALKKLIMHVLCLLQVP